MNEGRLPHLVLIQAPEGEFHQTSLARGFDHR
jgi:hypothetical protein